MHMAPAEVQPLDPFGWEGGPISQLESVVLLSRDKDLSMSSGNSFMPYQS